MNPLNIFLLIQQKSPLEFPRKAQSTNAGRVTVSSSQVRELSSMRQAVALPKKPLLTKRVLKSAIMWSMRSKLPQVTST